MSSDLAHATASELIQNWEQEKRIKAMKDEEVISLVCPEEIVSFRQAVACGFYWHSTENVRRLCDTVDALRAGNNAVYAALKEILTYGVEFDDPRLDYVVAHIDRNAIDDARAALALVEEKQ